MRNTLIVLIIVLFCSVIICAGVNIEKDIKQSRYIYKEQFVDRLKQNYPDGTIYLSPNNTYIALVLINDSIFAIRNQGYELEVVKLIKQ